MNTVVEIETDLAPTDLLKTLHEIERAFGRIRRGRWEARTLDLDLLSLGDFVAPDRETFLAWRDLPLVEQARRAPDTLILPHPRIQDRPFVLVPLAGIAPDWRHPVTGRTVTEMLDALDPDARAAVKPLD